MWYSDVGDGGDIVLSRMTRYEESHLSKDLKVVGESAM